MSIRRAIFLSANEHKARMLRAESSGNILTLYEESRSDHVSQSFMSTILPPAEVTYPRQAAKEGITVERTSG